MNIHKITFIILIFCFASISFAATQAPNIGDAIKQAEPPRDLPVSEENKAPVIERQEKPVMKDLSTATIFVKAFEIAGNKALTREELTAIANQPENINRDMTFGDIQNVAMKLTKYYRDKGYFVAKAYIPKQSITDGIVELMILEGEYGEVNVKNTSYVNDSRVNKILSKASEKKTIKSDKLEKQMLIINKTPGANLKKINISPGQKLGTSAFDFEIVPTKRVYGYLIGDNYGLRYTGEYRAMAGVGINSPFGMGDRLFFNGLISDNGGLANGRTAYLIPITSSGLTAELSYSHTRYELSEEYDYLDAKGRSDNISLELKYPLILSKTTEAYTSLIFSYKDMEDEMETFDTLIDKDTMSVKAEASYKKKYRLFGFNYSTKVKAGVKVGRLDFDEAEAEEADEAGADTAGTYSKLTASVENKIYFTKKLSLNTNLELQQALGNKNLDGSEDISLGGVYGVKVYPSGEESAENGYILNAELIYRLPEMGKLITMVSVFGDHAYAKPQYDFADEDGRSLSDVGIGGYAYYKTFFAKVYYAHGIGAAKIESEPEYNNKFLLQAGMTF